MWSEFEKQSESLQKSHRMKKLLFFIFLLSLPVKSQIITIPDANFKASLLLASPSSYIAQNIDGDWVAIDTNNNYEIEIDEALAIYELGVTSNYPINNLVGLEYFVNLTDFGTTYQPSLTSINVSTLTNLKVLSITYSGLTQLDVSGLSQLEIIIGYGNQLSTVTFNNNTALRGLSLNSNLLTSLNIRNLESLEYLTCSDNLLQNLQVSGLQYLQDLTCNNNQLQSLLLNDLPQLAYLQCSNNQITALNFDNFPVLNMVICHYNQLTTLDFSSCPLLYLMGCSHNNLTSINIKNGLAQFYYDPSSLSWGGNPNLTHICADADEIPPIQNFLYACQMPQPVTITSTCGLATSAFENTASIIFFPNPSEGVFTIMNLEKDGSLEIYDFLGKKIQEQKASNNQVVTLQSVGKGLYFAKILSGNKIYKTEKIVVE